VPRGRDPTAPQLQAPSKQSYVPLKRVQHALREKLNSRSSNVVYIYIYIYIYIKSFILYEMRFIPFIYILESGFISLQRDILKSFRAFLSLD